MALADSGSFVGAAKLLNVSTSHMSKVIATLERRLGVQLFRRNTRSVSPTETGLAFVEQGRRIIRERDELLSAIGGSAEPHGPLHITCSIALGERFVAPIVRHFGETYPRVSMRMNLTNQVLDLISEGYDLAVRTGGITDPRLMGRPIAMRPMITCASPGYLDEAGTPAGIADLERHNCLVGSSATWRFQRDGDAVDFRPAGRWHCNSGAAVADAATAGLGICQLPLFYVRDRLERGSLLPLLVDNRPPPEQIWAVYPARRHLVPKVQLLVDMLEAGLRDTLAAEPRTSTTDAAPCA